MGGSGDVSSGPALQTGPAEPRLEVLLALPWDQEYGGVASVAGNLATHLEQRGHGVCFFHPGPEARPARGITRWGFAGLRMALREPFDRERPLRSALGFWATLPLTLARLVRLLRAQRIGIVNVHYPLDCFVVFALCRWLLPFRLVVSIHGADLFPEGERMRRYPRALRLLLARADLIVAPSRSFLAGFLEVFPGCAPRAVAIHNGVDLSELEAGAPPEPADASLLCIAACQRKKGIDVLLRAFARMAPSRPGLRLVLVGDGPLRGELESLARTLGVDARVDFLGWRNRKQVVALLRGARLLALPSRSEPFGIAAVEAMACGKAVVASRVGGLREIVRDGETGVLVEPDAPEALAAALGSLLDDPERAARLGEAGRRVARAEFGRSRMGEAYLVRFLALAAGA